MLRRLASLQTVIAALCSASADASPWTRSQGDVFVESRIDWFRAEQTSGGIFDRVENVTYLEWGIADSIHLGGKIAFGETKIADATGQSGAQGVTEYEVFAQRTLRRWGKNSLSVMFGGGQLSRLGGGGRPGLASDGADLEARLLYGAAIELGALKSFWSAETAYRRRFGLAADQWRADASFGVEPARDLLILSKLSGVVSMGNAGPNGPDYDILRAESSLVWRAGASWSLRAGASWEAAARGLDRGRTFFFGIWSEF